MPVPHQPVEAPAPTPNHTGVVPHNLGIDLGTPIEAALAYAQQGWRVIPIPPGQKHPAIQAWQTAGSTDTERITHWWTQAPTHGVGIVTGAESGIWVLDVDVADGKAGDDTLADLEATHGALPDTHEVITGSGGRHLYFRWPSDQVIRNNASTRLGPGLDIRGEGGQVLAPPTVHPNGTPYMVELAGHPLADAPAWLLQLLTEPEPQPATTSTSASIGDRPGDLWANDTSWAQILEADGWTLHHVDRSGEHHWTRPGKARRDGTSATTGYTANDNLKVFTSSVPNLAAEETYTKLGYLAATRFGGDHGAAARALADNGWRSDTPDLADLIDGPAGERPRPATGPTLDIHRPHPDEWPTPEHLPVAPPPPPFPPDVLPGWIQDQVDNVSRQIHCAPDLPAMFALGALSVGSLGHFQVETRAGHTEHTTAYLVVAAPPSEGKSASLEMMMRPLTDLEERQIDQAAGDVARAESARRIAEKKAKAAEDIAANPGSEPEKAIEAATLRAAIDEVETPHEGRLTTTDATPERLAVLMARNSERLAVVSDESGALSFDRYGDKKRGSNLDLYLQAWSGRRVVVDRQTAPSVRLRQPLLSIVVGAQPEAWRKALGDEEFRTRGLGSRFMSCTPAARGHTRDVDLDRNDWDHAVDDTYNERMGALVARWAACDLPATIKLTVEARRAFSAWAQPQQARMGPDGDLQIEASWVSKMRDTVLRFSALLHLADGNAASEPVQPGVMERACRLGDYWIAHRLHEHTGDYDVARRLLSTLANLVAKHDPPDGLLTRALISKYGTKGLRTIEEIAHPVSTLVSFGWVRIDTSLGPRSGADSIGQMRAMNGLLVHPDEVRIAAAKAVSKGALEGQKTASGGHPAGTVTPGESAPSAVGVHGESTNAGRFGRPVPRSKIDPSSLSFSPFEGEPHETHPQRPATPQEPQCPSPDSSHSSGPSSPTSKPTGTPPPGPTTSPVEPPPKSLQPSEPNPEASPPASAPSTVEVSFSAAPPLALTTSLQAGAAPASSPPGGSPDSELADFWLFLDPEHPELEQAPPAPVPSTPNEADF